MEKLNVAIADDNENMLKVLGQVIGQEQDLSVVGTATNGEDTFHIIKEKETKIWNLWEKRITEKKSVILYVKRNRTLWFWILLCRKWTDWQ